MVAMVSCCLVVIVMGGCLDTFEFLSHKSL